MTMTLYRTIRELRQYRQLVELDQPPDIRRWEPGPAELARRLERTVRRRLDGPEPLHFGTRRLRPTRKGIAIRIGPSINAEP